MNMKDDILQNEYKKSRRYIFQTNFVALKVTEWHILAPVLNMQAYN